jgi:hypothetical protein
VHVNDTSDPVPLAGNYTALPHFAMAQAPLPPLTHLGTTDLAYVTFKYLVVDVKAAMHPYAVAAPAPAKATAALELAACRPASSAAANATITTWQSCPME